MGFELTKRMAFRIWSGVRPAHILSSFRASRTRSMLWLVTIMIPACSRPAVPLKVQAAEVRLIEGYDHAALGCSKL